MTPERPYAPLPVEPTPPKESPHPYGHLLADARRLNARVATVISRLGLAATGITLLACMCVAAWGYVCVLFGEPPSIMGSTVWLLPYGPYSLGLFGLLFFIGVVDALRGKAD